MVGDRQQNSRQGLLAPDHDNEGRILDNEMQKKNSGKTQLILHLMQSGRSSVMISNGRILR